MADIDAIFGKPFAEQVAAFRLRLGNLVQTAAWDDLWQEAHDRAFMVAGATKADLLADLAAAVDKSISQGRSLEEFRADFRQIVSQRGWHGWTGEGTKAGEAWRTRVIYRTNAKTTYAAGRHAQLTQGGFPYWVYLHGASREPREIHLHDWHGLVLPPDHEFWITHYPPNGWGCSCYVVGARTLEAARRLGGNPDKQLPPNWRQLNPRTGAPVGIDKGWAYAPGASVSGDILSLRDKLNQLPEAPAIDLIQSVLRSDAFERWLEAPEGAWPLVRITQADADRIGSRKVVADLSPETLRKQIARHPEITATDYQRAQVTISNPTNVVQDGERTLIFIRNEADGHVVVVKATVSGEGLFVTSLRRLSRREAERDRTIRRLLSKG